MDRRSKQMRRREGQAMAEFLVGLVGIMLLVVGLQQIAMLSRNGFEVLRRARKSMAEQLMDPMADSAEGFVFAQPTSAGVDGKNYTADDHVMTGTDEFFTEAAYFEFVDQTALSYYQLEYGRELPYDRITDSSSANISRNLDMLHAGAVQSVEVVPFLRRVIGRDSLHLQQGLWMPKLERLKQ